MSGFKFWLVVGLAAAGGYVLGTRAGRSRYREISKAAKHLWDDPSDDVPWSGGGFGRVVCVVDVGEPSCDGQ